MSTTVASIKIALVTHTLRIRTSVKSLTKVKVSKSSPKTQTAAESRTRQILLQFFEQSGVSAQFQFSKIDPAVKQRFLEITGSWDLGVESKILQKYAALGLIMATTAYRHTSVETQTHIALCMYLGFMADDDVMPLEALREFSPRFIDGQPQLHPVLTHLINELMEIRQHYSGFSANCITVSLMDFFNAEMFERDDGGLPMTGLGPHSAEHVDWMRWKSGLGDAFAALIWPKEQFPETQRYIQAIPYASKFASLANDLMSFHKELKAGETDNYVSKMASIRKQSVFRSLQDVADRLVILDTQIKSVLGPAGTPERQAWESFASGFIECHLHIPRYCLGEILPEFGI